MFDKFKNLPHGQRTVIMVVGLFVLWFSGVFSVVSIGLGSWLLWNWWQKKSMNKSSQQKSFQNPHQVSQQSQTMPPPPPPPQGLSPARRPTIDWRKKPKS